MNSIFKHLTASLYMFLFVCSCSSDEQDLNPKKFKVGPIESDSGNHLIDVASVFIGLLALLYFKKILKGK